MKTRVCKKLRFGAVAALAVCAASMFMAVSALAQASNDINPPIGSFEVARWNATGVQIYQAAPDGNGGFKWQFVSPEATLFNGGGQVVAHHFGTPEGPAWQSNNGSEVIGKKIGQRPSTFPDTIDELLVQGIDWAGHGMFSSVTFLQRLDTRGGAAPRVLPTSLGQTVRVPYTATYVFFESK